MRRLGRGSPARWGARHPLPRTAAVPARLRAFDVAVVILALPLALAVGAAVALAVFLDSPGSVFYRSRRIGRDGRPFDMLKFRTMRAGAAGPSVSAAGDERYTPLGRTLATWRLDELPQLWNVLKGDMRLVGPRPELPEFVVAFEREYRQILRVPPGLTGPAQLVYAQEGHLLAAAGDRVQTYRERILPQKVAIDLRYAERPSFSRDLRVLAGTALLPFRHLAWALARLATAPSGARLTGGALPALVVAAMLMLAGLFAAEAASGP
jgi:lipopolysaccharide/colanic/teichoic acid biosynthesis glycosyltransferase